MGKYVILSKKYHNNTLYDIIITGDTMQKNILILYTNYGTGHYTAAKGIEEYIIKKYPNYNVELFDPLSYSRPFINKLFAKTGQIVATRFRKFRGKLYQNQMYRNYTKTPWYFNLFIKLFWNKKIERKLIEYSPDIIISTQVGPTAIIATHKELFNAKLIAVFTDYGVHRMYTITHESVDIYMVPDNTIKHQMIDIGIKKDKIKVTGIPVRSQILNKDNKCSKEEIITRYHLLKNKPIFLFICGGGLGYDNAFKYFETLLKSEFNFSYIFIAGKNKKLYQKAIKVSNKYKKKGKVLGYVDKIDELIRNSDLIIGKPGGMITTESLNLDVPICAIEPIPGQENHNASFISNNQFGFYITNLKNFEIFLNNLKNNDIHLEEYKNNINKKFHKFSFIDIEIIK